MHFKSLGLVGIRSWGNCGVSLERRFNVFIGANNSGKSTLLRGALHFQFEDMVFSNVADQRLGHADQMQVWGEIHGDLMPDFNPFATPAVIAEFLGTNSVEVRNQQNHAYSLGGGRPFGVTWPHRLIYSFLSKRKSTTYSHSVTKDFSLVVRTSFENLYAKVDHVCNPNRPSYSFFRNACRDILGFDITTTTSSEGKHVALIVDNNREVPISKMGEGVVNILGLLVDLAIAERQVFVIEELENDLHPQALKKLLRLIASDGGGNQFLVSTHSNIVVRELCSQPYSKLFHVTMELVDRVPTSTVREVEANADDRRAVLSELGYDFADLDLHAAWLFLEESSAERIVRDFLIPWFAPKLVGRVRTFAAGGKDNVELQFEDFDRLFVFLSLESVYKDRAWVMIDGGDDERKVIDKLKAKWTPRGWSAERFSQFDKHEFEDYYPERFRTEVEAARDASDKRQKRNLKKDLLIRLIAWAESDPVSARNELERSAAEVITKLKAIEMQFQKPA
ncbi:MAG: hypothetical protein EAZ43_03315 [Betaproteobacteria bacterium]|nr:MAG: hypothetical protein EAZ43_03315 [Betaproteobacteria bacterium]